MIECGKGLVFAELLKGNNFSHTNFYTSSVTDYSSKVAEQKSKQGDRDIIEKFFENFSDETDDKFMHISVDQKEFIDKYLNVNLEKSRQLEIKTIDQAENQEWFVEQKKRLTSSKFGNVINRRQNIYPMSLLKTLFNTGDIKSKACTWGIKHEKDALETYVQRFDVYIYIYHVFLNYKYLYIMFFKGIYVYHVPLNYQIFI